MEPQMRRTKKKIEKPVVLDQWIEITRQDGKTVTTPYPPNKELERLRQEMDPPAVLVYRRQSRPSEFGSCPCARCTAKREQDTAD